MNADLTPALAAAGGGTALMAGIWTYERRKDNAMRASRVRLSLRFPVGLEPQCAFSALDGLSGLPYTNELIAEIAASEGAIQHFLWVPRAAQLSIRSILTSVIGSVLITEVSSAPNEPVSR